MTVVQEKGEGGAKRPVVSPAALSDVWPEAVTTTGGVVHMHGRLTATLVPRGNGFVLCTSRIPLHPSPGDSVVLQSPDQGTFTVTIKGYATTPSPDRCMEIPVEVVGPPFPGVRAVPVVVESWASERVPHTNQAMLLATTIAAVQSLAAQVDQLKAMNDELLKHYVNVLPQDDDHDEHPDHEEPMEEAGPVCPGPQPVGGAPEGHDTG